MGTHPIFESDFDCLTEHFRNHVEDLIANLGSEFISVDNDDQIEETVAQLKIKFIQMRTQLLEFENSDLLRMETDRAVRARIDLKGVEDQVARELGALRTLRRAFLSEMSRKLLKNTDFGDVINSIHPSKVKFLEANLEQLTSAHKARVRENYELKSQAPRLEARLVATLNRCRRLEKVVKDQKDQIKQLECSELQSGLRSRIVKPVFGGMK